MPMQYSLGWNFDDQLERFCLFFQIKNLPFVGDFDQAALKGTVEVSNLGESHQQDELVKKVEYVFDDNEFETLSFVLRLRKSGAIIVENFRLFGLNESKRIVHIDFKPQYGVLFNLTSFQKFSLQLSDCLNIDLHFELNGIVENLPDSIDCDKSVLQVLQKPNPDLVNDWVFCHNHGEHTYEPLPELEPIVLTCLEEVVYILTCDVDQILLESIEDKNQSIYLALIKRAFMSNVKGEYLEEDSQCSKVVEVDLNHKCVVAFKAFGFDHSSRVATSTSIELSQDDKLLKKYRMSFEVDWYRVEAELCRVLHEQLLCASLSVSSNDSKKLIESREWSIAESVQHLRIATLDYIHFV